MSGYARSPSPAERGLHTSQKELARIKRGHGTPLNTNPANAAQPVSTPRARIVSDFADSAVLQDMHHRSPSPGTSPRHYSHAQFSKEKAAHATELYNMPRDSSPPAPVPVPVPVYTQRYHPAPEVHAPWAPVDGENPYQFKDPLPPTRTQSPPPTRAYFTDTPYVPPPRQPSEPDAPSPPQQQVYSYQPQALPQYKPLYSSDIAQPPPDGARPFDWQASLRRGHYEDIPLRHPPPSPSPSPSPSRRVGAEVFQDDARPIREVKQSPRRAYVPNLEGNWIAMPGADEIIQMTHEQDTNQLLGVSTKDAEWSEIRVGQTVTGTVDPSTHEVELFLDTVPILRLFPSLQPDGTLILTPSPGTHGSSGYWEVRPTSAPEHDHVSPPRHPATHHYTIASPSRASNDSPNTPRRIELNEEGTVINIFT